ncbi:expressed unknown protein [Seminavis robusta]|uniref:Uncharacterized protein n=1 Tax=Seminavis robusta TaxID=568900 RepID=A0A9N8DHJ1_9STRA|nr:expressed unknown protein [Seminavis robusta]|eukprot:Sro69_g038520.1 n/a (1132) ;mRNA; r:41990-45687
MSNRRGGPGGRKGKNNKNKQGKGGPASSSLVPQIPPKDEYHNLSLPCCRLLYDTCQELWTVDRSLLLKQNQQQQQQRPASLLGQMLRNHLLEKRREEVAAMASAEASNPIGAASSIGAAVGPSPNKKKKKKKKKKGSKAPESVAVAQAAVSSSDNPTTTTTSSSPTTKLYNKKPMKPILLLRFLPLFHKTLSRSYPKKNQEHRGTALCITHQEVETAFQAITCPVCRHAIDRVLQQHSRQPVFLGGFHFGDHVPSYNNNNHNGLAIPIHNPQQNTTEPPSPSVDFDYVALEEGVTNHGGPWGQDSSIQGVPYFHPQIITSEPTTSNHEDNSNNNRAHNNNKQQQRKQTDAKGEEQWPPAKATASSRQQRVQLEWRFVSSSSASIDQTTTTTDAKKNENATTSVDAITIEDVEHVVKNVMLPLSLSADDLMGADTTSLDGDELVKLCNTICDLDGSMKDDLVKIKQEIVKYKEQLESNQDDSTNNRADAEIELRVGPAYEELETGLEQLLYEVVMDVVWDGLLWLSRDGDNVVRTTVSWKSAVYNLTEAVTRALLNIMQIVEEFENGLAEIADNMGNVPAMFVSKQHRVIYRKMLEQKINVLQTLINAVVNASSLMEFAWPSVAVHSISGNPDWTSKDVHERGLFVSFRRKWFAQQEFFRCLAKKQNRAESTRKGSPNTKAKNSQRNKTSPRGTPDSKPWENKVIQKLDTSGDDLLRSLIDLSKPVRIESIPARKEEQMVRCAKSMGLLERIGGDVFAPFADTENAKNHPISFALQDENLKNQCRTLSTQIKQQQTRQMLAPEEQLPSEQRRHAAYMTVNSIHLLRKLRFCVTDSYEQKTPEPVLPICVISWINNLPVPQIGQSVSIPHIDMRNCSYETLINAFLVQEKHIQTSQCPGGSGQPRLTAILLALLYGKLSDQCSQWHAELAEQELLTNMNESESGLQTGTQSGDAPSGSKKDTAAGRNGVATNQPPQGKTKKKKKKGSTKAQASVESATGSDQGAAGGAESNHLLQSPATEDAATMNGHQEPKGANVKTDETDGIKTKGNTTKDDNVNIAETTVGVMSDVQSAEIATENSRGEDRAEISTVEVDKNMGVRDFSGAVQSAEGFLVGRLTALFKEAAQGKGSVLIV